MGTIYVSKLDAAKRQLETSMKLFYNCSDPVSIHTLAAAAHEILYELGKEQKISSFIKDEMVKRIKPEKKNEYFRMINRARNFFKHAESDKEKTIDFNPRISEMLMWDASNMYIRLTSEQPPLLSVFISWFYLTRQELLVITEEKKRELEKIARDLDVNNKLSFFNEMLPVAEGNFERTRRN